jgi:hypothetical protein
MEIAIEVLDPAAVERRRAAAHAVNDIAFLQQQFGEIRAVLSGHTRN